jgi:hypothetical protein
MRSFILFVVRPATATAMSRNIHSTVVLFRRQLFGFFLPSRELLAGCWRELLRCPSPRRNSATQSKHSPRLYPGWSEAKSGAWAPGPVAAVSGSGPAGSRHQPWRSTRSRSLLPRCRTPSRRGPPLQVVGDDRIAAVPVEPSIGGVSHDGQPEARALPP